MDALRVILAWTAFAVFHSLTVSEGYENLARRWMGDRAFDGYHRLLFTAYSIAVFISASPWSWPSNRSRPGTPSSPPQWSSCTSTWARSSRNAGWSANSGRSTGNTRSASPAFFHCDGHLPVDAGPHPKPSVCRSEGGPAFPKRSTRRPRKRSRNPRPRDGAQPAVAGTRGPSAAGDEKF